MTQKLSSPVLAVLLYSIGFCLSCGTFTKKHTALAGYDIANPEKFIMPENLLEISGITFPHGKNDSIYAIQDEDGKLFKLALGIKKSYATKFAKKGDYEDLALLGDRVFVLRSDGTLFSFDEKASMEKVAAAVSEWKNMLPKDEYEGMYGLEDSARLYVLCKKCKDDDNKKWVTGYIIDARDSLKLQRSFRINISSLAGQAKRLNAGFKPSGIALNPITKNWYILSGSNKLLLVTDAAWQIKEVVPLNGNIFNQAEGIAFDQLGNLYISNEGEEETNGNILLFKRK